MGLIETIIQNPQNSIVFVLLVLLIISFVYFLFSKNKQIIEIIGIFLINAIAIIANNNWVFIADLFITATLFTEGKYLLSLMAIMRGDKEYFNYLLQSSMNTPSSEPEMQKSTMQYKILNTLWTKQVNYFPEYTKLWGFTINIGAIEYFDFIEAINQLIGRGWVFKGEQNMFFLTKEGFKFCAKNYSTFLNPENQYWPEEQINTKNRKTAIKKANTL